jgi:hypothetical protein
MARTGRGDARLRKVGATGRQGRGRARGAEVTHGALDDGARPGHGDDGARQGGRAHGAGQLSQVHGPDPRGPCTLWGGIWTTSPGTVKAQ